MSESQKYTPPVPTTVEALLQHRKTNAARNLNDDVEQIHLRLWEKPEYQKYFTPIWREDTIEGSFILDESMAALQVRKYAVESDGFQLAKMAKLGGIIRSLHVVLRRYTQSRKERQHMVGGEHVDGNDNGNNDC